MRLTSVLFEQCATADCTRHFQKVPYVHYQLSSSFPVLMEYYILTIEEILSLEWAIPSNAICCRAGSCFFQVPNWYHFKCFWKRARVAGTSDIHGFEALRWEDQEKIKEALSGKIPGKIPAYLCVYLFVCMPASCLICKQTYLKSLCGFKFFYIFLMFFFFSQVVVRLGQRVMLAVRDTRTLQLNMPSQIEVLAEAVIVKLIR